MILSRWQGRTRWWAALKLMWCAGFVACAGEIQDSEVASSSQAGTGGQTGEPSGDMTFVGDETPTPGGEACVAGTGRAGTRLVRLTHTQYDQTVQALLGLEVSPADEFLTDATFAGFDNNAEGLVVPDRLARDYRRAAESLAVAAVADAESRKRLVPCDTGATGCARTAIETLGRRAFRRPLSDTEIEAYTALHGRGAELVGSGDGFFDGVQLVLEAMLQSPKFLYRVELSQPVSGSQVIKLSGFELASRLSYMLWNSMPDDILLDAAAAGELDTPEGIAVAARRMMQVPEARAVLDDFARQWLDFSRFDDLSKDASQFPDFRPELGTSMSEEVRLFLRDLVFEQDGGFASLYTEPSTYVDDALASVYGLPAPGDGMFEKVSLDATQRSGLLTQVGFLASHAFADRSSPIHRGVFIHRKILCTNLPEPPGDVDFNLPAIEGDIKTTRQQVEVHTSPNQCAGCHGLINPVGFAFENYDALGRYRTLDFGEQVDASGTLTIDGQQIGFDGAVELSGVIAESEVARKCFATQYMRYAYGRRESGADRCTLAHLATRLGDPGYSIQDLILDLTQTRAFNQRPAEVGP